MTAEPLVDGRSQRSHNRKGVVCGRIVLLLLALHAASGKDLRIGVFGLFHPSELILRAAPGIVLRVNVAGAVWELEGSRTARLRVGRSGVLCTVGDRTASAELVRASGPQGRTDFFLSVPGRIDRRFAGAFEVRARDGELVPVVITDLETAVASAVAAESLSGAPMEALKAQAIAARSFYLASPARHRDFQFCDTTHCQFLREPPKQTGAAGAAEAAAAETKGLVLLHEDAVLAALFSASCGGRTRTLAEAGMAAEGYPYYSIECPSCLSGARDWERSFPADYARLIENRSEAHRIELGRVLGWDVIPGYNYQVTRDGDRILVHGRGEGHGIGLCQRGASAMAASGLNYRVILNYYYPNTVVGFRE
jgi:peptidoglycan hydrolase-like amidase